MDPAEISRGLGASPSFSWKAGENRTTPTGQQLQGVNVSTYWCSEPLQGQDSELAAAIASDLSIREAHRRFLTDFCSTGGVIEYFIGWFANGLNVGETFDSELLKRLADLKIDLSFDVYGDENHTPSEGT